MATKRIIVALAVAGAAAVLARRAQRAVPDSLSSRLGAYVGSSRERLPQGIMVLRSRWSRRAQELPTSAQDSATITQTVYDAFNRRDFDQGAALVAEDFEWVNRPLGQTFRGPTGYRQFLQRRVTAFPDARIEITNRVAAGDWVATEFTLRGTHTGPLTGPAGQIPPTGRSVEVPVCEVIQVQKGKLVRARPYFDAATMMRQLGLLPEPE